jgi:hypothetical protein
VSEPDLVSALAIGARLLRERDRLRDELTAIQKTGEHELRVGVSALGTIRLMCRMAKTARDRSGTDNKEETR